MVLLGGLDQLLTEIPEEGEFTASAAPARRDTNRDHLALWVDVHGVDVSALVTASGRPIFFFDVGHGPSNRLTTPMNIKDAYRYLT